MDVISKAVREQWKLLAEMQTDEEIYNTLKAILQKVVKAKEKGEFEECFTPASVTQLAVILEVCIQDNLFVG